MQIFYVMRSLFFMKIIMKDHFIIKYASNQIVFHPTLHVILVSLHSNWRVQEIIILITLFI